MNGTPIQGAYCSNAEYKGSPELEIRSMNTIFSSPKKFTQSKRIYFKGQEFNVEQIIRFIANKVGGVHYDESREHSWHQPLEDASKYFSVGNPDNEVKLRVKDLAEAGGACMVILPSERGIIWISIDIELLSIAQSFSNIHCNNQRLLTINGEN